MKQNGEEYNKYKIEKINGEYYEEGIKYDNICDPKKINFDKPAHVRAEYIYFWFKVIIC